MNDMKKLAFLCDAIAEHGHRIVVDADGKRGTCGPSVTYGIREGKPYLSVFGLDVTEDQVKTFIADLLNGVDRFQYMAWKVEQAALAELEGSTP